MTKLRILNPMKVEIDGKELEVKRKKIRVERLLRDLGINPEVALVLKNGKLVPEDEEIREGDRCQILLTVGTG